MYAVIKTGGKQERVTEGQRLAVELLGAPVGEEVDLEAVLVVDGTEILATPDQLAGASVRAQVVGLELGPKIRAGTYKSKSNQRRRWGHRQRFSTIEILSISGSATKKAAPRKSRAKAAEPADAE
jgi:large subunit ribosomal protein L21